MVLHTSRAPAGNPDARLPGKLVCQVLPGRQARAQESDLRLFNHLFATARKRITVSPSFVLDRQVNLLATGRDLVDRMDTVVAAHWEHSHEPELSEWPGSGSGREGAEVTVFSDLQVGMWWDNTAMIHDHAVGAVDELTAAFEERGIEVLADEAVLMSAHHYEGRSMRRP
ncbi:hypothetical protein E8P82_10485 [Arthrobacter echini]|uniref:Uncharacterized protein n=1 Tax=Arthrobacter echini TaxID=1529066 RepID=A0A4S5E3N9_9MICC|nr:hypothetical protein [Arthrobacter echini]THJ66048.1 hypothetical protein E8P82_10485 [Arthrobacter echini]